MTADRRFAVFHFGARLHYAVAVLLSGAGALECLFTDAYAGPGSPLRHAISACPRRFLTGSLARLSQRVADIPEREIVAFNRLGLQYALAQSRAHKTHTAPKVFREYNCRFTELIAKHPRFSSANAVYGFCSASAELFREAKRQGKYCVLEQMVAPFNEMTSQIGVQEHRWPGWSAASTGGWDVDAWTPLEEEEWRIADVILAPSRYVCESLIRAGVSSEKVRLVPYGVRLPERRLPKLPPAGRPLRALYAGAVDLRKGAPNLITAAHAFGAEELELRMAGHIGLERQRLSSLPPHIRLLGQVPRAAMSQLYEWADVFVLPTVCEGSATVCYEALSHGVPVIASPNAGAPFEHGHGGIILADLEPDSIAHAITQLRSAPELISSLSTQALELRDYISWESYGARLRRSLLE